MSSKCNIDSTTKSCLCNSFTAWYEFMNIWMQLSITLKSAFYRDGEKTVQLLTYCHKYCFPSVKYWIQIDSEIELPVTILSFNLNYLIIFTRYVEHVNVTPHYGNTVILYCEQREITLMKIFTHLKFFYFSSVNNKFFKFSPELQYSPVYIRESPHQASKTRGYCIKLDLFELSVLAYLR